MTETIQKKIDKIIQLAASSKAAQPTQDTSAERLSHDSLSRSIRNKKEADQFLAALNDAIKTASRQ